MDGLLHLGEIFIRIAQLRSVILRASREVRPLYTGMIAMMFQSPSEDQSQFTTRGQTLVAAMRSSHFTTAFG